MCVHSYVCIYIYMYMYMRMTGMRTPSMHTL